ncbi:hypothetical protein GCM10027256_11830 [Novispirillum itersonii subsp. nipponicum]
MDSSRGRPVRGRKKPGRGTQTSVAGSSLRGRGGGRGTASTAPETTLKGIVGAKAAQVAARDALEAGEPVDPVCVDFPVSRERKSLKARVTKSHPHASGFPGWYSTGVGWKKRLLPVSPGCNRRKAVQL